MSHEQPDLTVIGGGFAGAEAAWAAANAGLRVHLHEMRPKQMTPAHQSGDLAEMVCSNTLKSKDPADASGMLKKEMLSLGSLILPCAYEAEVPAGRALAVDREVFAQKVTAKIAAHPNITRIDEVVTELPKGPAIIATGPLTDGGLAEALGQLGGQDNLHFYDAMAPIVEADSIDMDKAFFASRYDKGEDYINCPMNKEQYETFHRELLAADMVPLKDFEDTKFFESCLPIEELAKRGLDTPRFGPMKPVGLTDPNTGHRPWAVVQLRQDNLAKSHFNMVGFQNHLKWGEQKRVFRLIPGLEKAEFVRFGVIHRNTYLNSPQVLDELGRIKAGPHLFLAGQLSGVEGYLESAASGLLAGIQASNLHHGLECSPPPPETMLGALHRYVTQAEAKYFAPMNAAFGLLDPPAEKIRNKKERRLHYVERGRQPFQEWANRFASRHVQEDKEATE